MAHRLFVAACSLFLVAASGGYSLVVACGLLIVMALVLEHRLLGTRASLVLTHGFSCSLVCGILLPGPGIELMLPALAARFLTTGPLGKSHSTNSKDHEQ